MLGAGATCHRARRRWNTSVTTSTPSSVASHTSVPSNTLGEHRQHVEAALAPDRHVCSTAWIDNSCRKADNAASSRSSAQRAGPAVATCAISPRRPSTGNSAGGSRSPPARRHTRLVQQQQAANPSPTDSGIGAMLRTAAHGDSDGPTRGSYTWPCDDACRACAVPPRADGVRSAPAGRPSRTSRRTPRSRARECADVVDGPTRVVAPGGGRLRRQDRGFGPVRQRPHARVGLGRGGSSYRLFSPPCSHEPPLPRSTADRRQQLAHRT